MGLVSVSIAGRCDTKSSPMRIKRELLKTTISRPVACGAHVVSNVSQRSLVAQPAAQTATKTGNVASSTSDLNATGEIRAMNDREFMGRLMVAT